MNRLSITLPFAFFLLFAGCNSLEKSGSKALEGYNMQGQKGSCEPMPKDKICTEIFTEQDQYGARCAELGHEAIRCDCHEFLCSEKIDF
ncbi:MAG: hypothetical protein WEB87_03250 [Bacteriovoracaceae bacterium]